MAALREADRIPGDVDWSVSHRRPPPLPNSPRGPPHATYPHHQQQQQQPPLSSSSVRGADPLAAIGVAYSGPPPPATIEQPRTRSRSGSSPWAHPTGKEQQQQQQQQQQQEGRRRGSFSFLRRTTSNSSATSAHNNTYTTDRNAPPLPRTLIAAATHDAAQRKASSESTYRQPKIGGWRKNSVDSSSSNHPPPSNMLRKSSRLAKEKAETERLAREAAAVPISPPQLPTFTTGTIGSLDETRPDSVAIFNTPYPHSNQQYPRSTANFSRPSALMAPASTTTNSSSPPAYAIRTGSGLTNSSSPAAAKGSGEYVVDPTGDRTESMTNRGRYSYASSVGQVNPVNSPRRVRRRKDPTPFNVLVIGAKNSGKTSFISFLRHSLALPAHKQPLGNDAETQVGGNRSSFTSHYLESEIEGERVGLTLWDSVGFEKNIVDLQLREMTAFVEAKFEDTFVEEQKVMRSPGVKDTHIHCVLLILDPVRLDSTIAGSASFSKSGSHAGSLDDDLDLQVMRALWGKTTVIPVVSKADTLTAGHMSFLKRAVWESLKGAKLDPLEALELEDDDGEDDDDAEANDLDSEAEDDFPVPKARKAHKRVSSLSLGNGTMSDENETPYIPMSILSPDPYDFPPYVPKHKAPRQDQVGRRFPWGFADPYDPEHCDFGRLRDSVFKEWRTELRELSRSKWYENWRTSRLKNLPGSRQRIKGGVTPVAAVPREGRMASGANTSRQFSGSNVGVPRTVSVTSSANTASTGVLGGGNGVGESRNASGTSQTGSVVRGQ